MKILTVYKKISTMIASEAKFLPFLLTNVGPNGRFGGERQIIPKSALLNLNRPKKYRIIPLQISGSARAFDNANQGLCRHKASGAFCLLIRFV